MESLIKQDAEANLLGSFISSPSDIKSYKDKLQPEMFGLEANRLIWAKMLEMADNQVTVDLITLKDSFTDSQLDAVGGRSHLATLLINLPDIPATESYFKIVEEFFIRRKYREIAEELREATETAASVNCIQLIADRARVVASSNTYPSLAEAAESAIERLASERKLTNHLAYGVPELDELLGGIRRGKLTVIGGRTSHGKTTVCANLILHNLKRNDKARIIYSGFENIEDIPIKLASLNSGIPLSFFSKPETISDENLDRVMGELLKLGEYRDRLLLLSSEGPAKLRQVAREYKPDIVILDYVQRAAEKVSGKDEKDRRLTVGRIASDMQDIGIEFKCASILMSQLKRPEHDRAFKPPELSDLKEAGELENYADFVPLLWWPWREQMNDSKFSQDDYRFEVKKNKLGPCKAVQTKINLNTLKIG